MHLFSKRTVLAILLSLTAILVPASRAAATVQCRTVACPHITSVTPGSGPAAGGYTVTIDGTGLAEAGSVQFGAGNYAPDFISTATSITAAVPAGHPAHVHLIVTTPDGTAKYPWTYTTNGG